MTTMVCSEVNENRMKSFLKCGFSNTGDLVSVILMSSNEFLSSRFHLISFPFLSIQVIFFIILTRFGMNLLKKFTFSRKDSTSFLLCGVLILKITSTLLQYIFIPYFEMMHPNSFPSCISKCDFFGFKDMLNFLHFWKTFFKCPRCCSSKSEYTVIFSK
jgi:hypothetical protein